MLSIYLLKLKMRDKTSITIGNSYRKVDQISHQLSEQISKVLLPYFAEQIEAGQRIKIASLVLSDEGLQNGSVKTSWANVEQIKILNGFLYVKASGSNGRMRELAGMTMSEPNVFILPELLGYCMNKFRYSRTP